MTTISISLDIPNIEVINIETLENGSIIIHVKSTVTGTCCQHCGKYITKYHGLNSAIMIRHLPIFENQVYIKYQSVRYQCIECKGHPTTTQKASWYQMPGKCTEQYALYIIKLLINSTIQDVVLQERISYKTVVSILKKTSLIESTGQKSKS